MKKRTPETRIYENLSQTQIEQNGMKKRKPENNVKCKPVSSQPPGERRTIAVRSNTKMGSACAHT